MYRFKNIIDTTNVSGPLTGLGTVGGGFMGFLNEYYIAIGIVLTAAQVLINWYYKHKEFGLKSAAEVDK